VSAARVAAQRGVWAARDVAMLRYKQGPSPADSARSLPNPAAEEFARSLARALRTKRKAELVRSVRARPLPCFIRPYAQLGRIVLVRSTISKLINHHARFASDIHALLSRAGTRVCQNVSCDLRRSSLSLSLSLSLRRLSRSLQRNG